MTIGEFKAWLDGFSEAMGSSPNVKQWKKIQERLESVNGDCYHYGTTTWWPTWYSYTVPAGEVVQPTYCDSGTTYTIAASEIGRAEATNLAAQ